MTDTAIKAPEPSPDDAQLGMSDVMRVVVEWPPIIDDIEKVFGDLHTGPHQPVFAWGKIIYNPFAHKLEAELIAHEAMHGQRQGHNEMSILRWWTDYLQSASFRLEEEIPAHRAEYRQLLRMHGHHRGSRKHWLKVTAARMRSPLYGYNHLVTKQQAINYIALGPDEAMGAPD